MREKVLASVLNISDALVGKLGLGNGEEFGGFGNKSFPSAKPLKLRFVLLLFGKVGFIFVYSIAKLLGRAEGLGDLNQ